MSPVIRDRVLVWTWLVFLSLWVWTEITEDTEREARWQRVESYLEGQCKEICGKR